MLKLTLIKMVSIIDAYKNNVSPITIYLITVACEKDYKIFCVQLTLLILKINLLLLKPVPITKHYDCQEIFKF